MVYFWTADDIPAPAYTFHTDFSSIRTPLQQKSQACTRLVQTPNPPPTLASAPGSLAVPSTSWPIFTPASIQTDPRRLKTEVTKLQTSGHPAGSAKWNFTPRWSAAESRAAATTPRHISFERSIPVSTPFTSVLPLSARAEGSFSCSAVPCAGAVSAEQQPSGSNSKRKRASERGGAAHSQHAQYAQHARHAQHAQHAQHVQHAQQAQQAEGSIGPQLSAEIPYRPMKRIKGGLSTLTEQHPEMSDATVAPQSRELRAMTSVRGSRHTLRPRSERQYATRHEAVEASNRGADQQAIVVMETTVQQLQFELMVSPEMCISKFLCSHTSCLCPCPASILQATHPCCTDFDFDFICLSAMQFHDNVYMYATPDRQHVWNTCLFKSRLHKHSV